MIRLFATTLMLILVTGSLGLSSAGTDPDDLLRSDAYDVLHASLSAHPGFLGLAPDRDGGTVLHAAFSGDAPTAPLGLLPAGWTLRIHEGQTPETLRVPVSSVTDIDDLSQPRRDGIPPLPEDAVGLGPGTPILQTIPGEGTFICTANYVFTSGNKVYLGTAGHCVLPGNKDATHGPGADYDASGVTVRACIDFCFFGGFLQGFFGDMVTLGEVAYARQTGPGGDIGNDFAVIEVPSSLHGDVRPEMPVWDGPTGTDGGESLGRPVVHYGNGIDAGTFMATKGRTGAGLNDGDAASIQMNILINGGDSGSAINHAWISASDGYEGTEALGLITHGLIVSAVPLGWGTSIDQAISMAGQAGLSLDLVLEGETV